MVETIEEWYDLLQTTVTNLQNEILVLQVQCQNVDKEYHDERLKGKVCLYDDEPTEIIQKIETKIYTLKQRIRPYQYYLNNK